MSWTLSTFQARVNPVSDPIAPLDLTVLQLTLGVANLRLIPRRGAAIMIEWMILFPSPTQANVSPLSDP